MFRPQKGISGAFSNAILFQMLGSVIIAKVKTAGIVHRAQI